MAVALDLMAALEARCIATCVPRGNGASLKRPSAIYFKQLCSPVIHTSCDRQKLVVQSSLHNATAQRQDEEATTELELNLRRRRPIHERYGVKIEREVSEERLQVKPSSLRLQRSWLLCWGLRGRPQVSLPQIFCGPVALNGLRLMCRRSCHFCLLLMAHVCPLSPASLSCPRWLAGRTSPCTAGLAGGAPGHAPTCGTGRRTRRWWW